jgi:formate hydrogenlyase subunit 3/multisubunit Na+/H+ antiporter MnhD subunit
VFLIVALFAGTGMFPFATFHSELMILNAAVTPKYYAVAVFAVICLAIMFVGIARIVLDVVHGKPTEPILPRKENMTMNVSIAVAAIILIVLGLWIPSRLETLLAGAYGTV